jgi:hypothetical protein
MFTPRIRRTQNPNERLDVNHVTLPQVGQIGNFFELVALQNSSVLLLAQRVVPRLMHRPLIPALPIDILPIVKSAGEKA